MFRLETPRLTLREMRAEDATALLQVFSDPRVMASFPGETPFDANRMAAWVGRNLEHQRDHGYGLFSVIDKRNGVLIGDCGLERLEIGVGLISLIRMGNEASRRVAEKIGMTLAEELDRNGAAHWLYRIQR